MSPTADGATAGPIRVKCDLCGYTEQRERYRLAIGALVSCPRCDLTYVSPRLPSATLQAKLQAWAGQDVVDAERLRLAFEPRTLELYGEFLAAAQGALRTSGRRLLDVGCSTGALMSAARDAGWQVAGIELGEASAAYASRTLGFDIHHGSLFDFPGAPAEWDAIAFLEVIEHLESPRAALARIVEWLKPGGVLLVSTPNFDSLFRRLFGTRWWVVNCEDEHIVLFNRQTLERALQNAGLEVESCRIRGLDLAGMGSALCGGAAPAQAPQATAAEHGYHKARSRKEHIKAALERLGVLNAARGLLGRLERRFADRHSMAHAWGEQLVMVARKQL
jgi:2-polyprenyl-3-methyl-5-hydroxy-6-metoxy-1,4-benzoquinol methylase